MHLISYCSTIFKVLLGQNVIPPLQPAVHKPQFSQTASLLILFIKNKTKPQQTSVLTCQQVLLFPSNSRMKA